MEKLIAVLVMAGVALAVVLVFFGLNRLLGPRSSNEVKDTPFETGRAPMTEPGHRPPVKFYMIAILFVLFDIELIFFYPWAVSFHELGLAGLVSMSMFMAVLVLGLAYVWKRGALEWR